MRINEHVPLFVLILPRERPKGVRPIFSCYVTLATQFKIQDSHFIVFYDARLSDNDNWLCRPDRRSGFHP